MGSVSGPLKFGKELVEGRLSGRELFEMAKISPLSTFQVNPSDIELSWQKIWKTFCRISQRTRVARWHSFKPNIPIGVNFGGPCTGKGWYSL
jgi:hypothetical protein